MIYTQDGWIITNDHVVAGADSVKVVMSDGREIDGEIHRIGDQQLDIALVKVKAKNLPTLKFSESDSVRVGQFAIAVGAPFGLANSVTVGHVSAIGRPGLAGDRVSGPRVYRDMIQTDAAINPGNSGGPLINIDGEVIGINTTIYSPTGTSSGIGFAIPANIVRVVADEMIATGKFDRGFIGIEPVNLKPYQLKERKIDGGALVSSVLKTRQQKRLDSKKAILSPPSTAREFFQKLI